MDDPRMLETENDQRAARVVSAIGTANMQSDDQAILSPTIYENLWRMCRAQTSFETLLENLQSRSRRKIRQLTKEAELSRSYARAIVAIVEKRLRKVSLNRPLLFFHRTGHLLFEFRQTSRLVRECPRPTLSLRSVAKNTRSTDSIRTMGAIIFTEREGQT